MNEHLRYDLPDVKSVMTSDVSTLRYNQRHFSIKTSLGSQANGYLIKWKFMKYISSLKKHDGDGGTKDNVQEKN